jgi:hypothetical protein
MIKAKKLTIIMVTLSLVIVWLLAYYRYYGWEFFGYEFVNAEENNIHLVQRNEIKIASTIIDYEWQSGYLVGLRLKVDFLECESRKKYHQTIRVSKNRAYFILNVFSGELINFTSNDEFQSKLSSLQLISNIDLDYSKFSEVESFYMDLQSRMNYSTCVKIRG